MCVSLFFDCGILGNNKVGADPAAIRFLFMTIRSNPNSPQPMKFIDAYSTIVKRHVRKLILTGAAMLGLLSGGLGVLGVIASPTAVDDTGLTTPEDTALSILFATLTGNDTGTSLTITSVGSANNGSVTLNSSTSTITFTPSSHFKGTATFSYTIQDSLSAIASATVTVNVTAVSSTPTLTVQSTSSGDEDTAIPLNISITSPDASEALTVKISNIPAGASLDNFDHNVPLIVSGAVTLTSGQLSGLAIKPVANDSTSFTLSVQGFSQDGTATVVSTTSVSLSVTVHPVSDAPILTVQNASGNEDTAIPLTITITATDPSETLTVTINDIPNGATLLDNSNSSTPFTISSSGSATFVPSLLTGLKIKPAPNSAADFTLHVLGTSQDGTVTPVSTQPLALTVAVNPINDPPTFTKGTDITVDEDAGPQFISNWATAISPGPNEFGQVLSFAVTIPTSATSLFSVAPAISPEGHLTFTTAPNANGAAVVTVTLKDNGGSDPTTGASDTSASLTFNINVNAVNDPPIIIAPAQQAVNEDTPLVFSSTRNNLISVSDVDAGSHMIRVSLAVNNGNLKLKQTTGLTFPSGNDNTASMTIEGTITDVAGAFAEITYTPISEFNGQDTFVIVADDRGPNGGVSGLIDTRTITINVLPVNDPPVFTSTAFTFNINENSPPGTFIGRADATDPDPGTGLNFAITSGNVGGVFVINQGTGEIFVNGPLDYETLSTGKNYTLSVLVTDNGTPALSASATVTINVQDVNEPPHIKEQQVFLVDENSPDGTVVTQSVNGSPIDHVVANDPDTGAAGVLTYSIVSGGEGRFSIVSTTGQIKVVNNTSVGPIDFEARQSYNLVIQVTDGGTTPLSDLAGVVVNVRDVNEPPIIQNQSFSVDENAPSGTFVGNVVATDPDAGTRLNFSITAGDPDHKFGIDLLNGQILTKAPLDFETTPSYGLTVTVTDNGNPVKSSSATVTVSVNNVNEIPLNNVPGPQTVNEGGTLTFSSATTPTPNPISISDDSGIEQIDVTLSVDHGVVKLATGPTLTILSGADNTGRIRFRANLSDINTVLNGLQYLPAPHFNGPDFLDVLTDDRGFSGVGGPLSRLSSVPIHVMPVIDGQPTVKSVTTPFLKLSDEVIVIERNSFDGPEVSHFQITGITGGHLFQNDGHAEIQNNNFITVFEAQQGLRFQPTAMPTATAPVGFNVQAALKDETASLGGSPATVSINVVKADQTIDLGPVPFSKVFIDTPPATIPVNATATSGLAVQLQVSGPASLSGNTITITGAGIVNLTATQAGDDQYNQAPSISHFIQVFKANQNVNLSPIPNKLYGDPDFSVTATASSSLPIRLEVASGPAILTQNGQVHLLGAGFVSLVASQDGNQNFNPAQPAVQTFNVERATLTITADSMSRSFGQPNPSLTGNTTGFKNQDAILVNFETVASQQSPPGQYPIFPTFDDPAGRLGNYALNITRGVLTVNENAAPVATPQTAVLVAEDTSVNITLAGTDAETSPSQLTFEILQGPLHGNLTGQPPTVTYTPGPNYNGPDSFTFVADDGLRKSQPATVGISVTAVNDPPTLAPIKNFGVSPNAPVISIPLFGITAGPSDEQQAQTTQATLTVTATSTDTSKVTVVGVDYTAPASTGAVRIQPVANVTTGSANIVVTVDDHGAANSQTSQTFTVTITGRRVRVINTAALAGTQFAVPVELAAQGDENSLSFSVLFDPTKLTFVAAAPGADATGANLQVNSHDPDRVGVGLALAANQVFTAGTKQVVLLSFNAAVTAPEGDTQLGFSPGPAPFQVVNAQASGVSAAFNIGTVTISHGYEADVTTARTVAGDPRLSPDNDGNVGTTDWVQIGRFFIHLDTINSPSEFQRADCAPRETLGDGVVDLADWVQAGRYAAGLDKGTDGKVPKGGGPSGTPQTQGLTSHGSSVALKSTSGVARHVRLTDRRVRSGQTFAVLASIEARGDENAVGFSLNFDPASLNFIGARLADGAPAATILTNDKDAVAGRIGLAIALPAGQAIQAGTKSLIELEFSSKASQVDGGSLIQVADLPVQRAVVSVDADPLRASFADAQIVIVGQESSSSEIVPSKNLAALDRSSTGEMFLRLTGEPGTQYIIESSTDLTTWVPMKTVTLTNHQLEWADTDARNSTGRFYRARPVR